jgi:glycosyltransferase involved in cell wall biosynthesis
MSPSKVDIILVTWGRPELTRATIDSIVANTDREHYRLIVIDNRSSPSLVSMLLEYHTTGVIDELILNETNLGLEPARNQGLAKVENLYLVCVDNDLLCPPRINGKDWVERMLELIGNNQEYAAIAMRTQVMIGTGNIFEGHEDEDIVEFPHPGGSYRIMDTALVRKLGGWRNHIWGRGSEEKHICGELHKLGAKTGFAVKIKSLHLFGDKETDGWGYPIEWIPADSGHSDIWHPVLINGDDPEQIDKFLETGQYE